MIVNVTKQLLERIKVGGGGLLGRSLFGIDTGVYVYMTLYLRAFLNEYGLTYRHFAYAVTMYGYIKRRCRRCISEVVAYTLYCLRDSCQYYQGVFTLLRDGKDGR